MSCQRVRNITPAGEMGELTHAGNQGDHARYLRKPKA